MSQIYGEDNPLTNEHLFYIYYVRLSTWLLGINKFTYIIKKTWNITLQI